MCLKLNGGTVSWSSRKQDIVSLSSMESEYIALSEACKELQWVNMIVKSLNCFSIPKQAIVNTDSQSSMKLMKNQKFSNRSKHVDTKYHYVRNLMENEEIELKYCSTEENVADMMTKPLGTIKLQKFRKDCGLV